MSCRFLYVSGSIGLGHVTRDLAIAREVRRLCPEIEIDWVAGSPAREVLAAAGENLVSRLGEYRSDTDLAEAASRNGRLNLTSYVFRAMVSWFHNAHYVQETALRGKYDGIVGDETYEVLITNLLGVYRLPPVPFIVMYDFMGIDVTSGSIFEQIGAWAINLLWANAWRVTTRGQNGAIFFGELEDVADRPFGFLLPDRRQMVKKYCEIVGYPLPFDLKDVPPKNALRRELGYGDGPLVVCAVGGTSVGRDLLELCGRAYPLLKEQVPDMHMVLVAGPRIDPQSLKLPDGVDCRGMVPNLWRHLAASDLAVVQGGGATTLELEALRVPFLFFPVEHQAEQEVTVAGRLARHGAGKRMRISTTNPQDLADAVAASIGTKATYPEIPVSGTLLAAKRILAGAGIPVPSNPIEEEKLLSAA